MNADDFANFLYDLAWDIPMLVVFLVGVVVSLLRISRYAGPSILTLIGCIIVLLSRGTNILLRYLSMTDSNLKHADGFRMLRHSLPWLVSIGIAVILIAVFVGRQSVNAAEKGNP